MELKAIPVEDLKEYLQLSSEFDDYMEEFMLGNNQGGNFMYHKNRLIDSIRGLGVMK